MSLPKWSEADFRSNAGEDHLGILSVGTAIAEYLLPSINTITPRARYRSFFCWVLADFLENSKDKSRDVFKKHLKRREMAYILANLAGLKEGQYSSSLIGVTRGQEIWNSGQNLLIVDQPYLKNEYGGYGTYRGVMQTMHLIQGQDNPALMDAILPQGRVLAEAFQKTISHTLYYQHYLDKGLIPRDVLKEYGEVAGLDQIIGDECDHLVQAFIRSDLPNKMREVQRRETLAYMLHAVSSKPANKWQESKAWRNFLLYSRFQDETEYTGIGELSFAQNGWMVYQIRQYFAYALETLFCYLLEVVHRRSMGLDEFLETALKKESVQFDEHTVIFDPYSPLQDALDSLPRLNLEKGYLKISGTKFETLDVKAHFITPVLMLLEIYKLVINLKTDPYCWKYVRFGGDNHVSMEKMVTYIESLMKKESSLKKFCTIVMSQYVVKQHHSVALEKLLGYKLETFRMIDNEGILEFRSAYRPNFNGFRGHQAIAVLTDLGLLLRDGTDFLITPNGNKLIQEVRLLARSVKAREWGEEDGENATA